MKRKQPMKGMAFRASDETKKKIRRLRRRVGVDTISDVVRVAVDRLDEQTREAEPELVESER